MPKRYLVPMSVVMLLVSGCLLVLGGTAVGSEEGARTIRIWDGCDPETFNEAIGPGTCLPGDHPGRGAGKLTLWLSSLGRRFGHYPCTDQRANVAATGARPHAANS